VDFLMIKVREFSRKWRTKRWTPQANWNTRLFNKRPI